MEEENFLQNVQVLKDARHNHYAAENYSIVDFLTTFFLTTAVKAYDDLVDIGFHNDV